MRQKTLKDVTRLAKVLRATICSDGIECRKGHYWAEGDVHFLAGDVDDPHDRNDLIERMCYGTSPCLDVECEWCYEEE